MNDLGETSKAFRVLIVEDVDHKFEEIIAAMNAPHRRPLELVRAKTVVEATDHISQSCWDLLLLDISMDIAPGSGGPTRDGHANLGGMDVLEQMYLLGLEAPTVIITGFDYFVKTSADAEIHEAQTLADLERQARGWISSKLLGCIRYGAIGWEHRLEKIVREL
jgi:CheY-like chemotaxis protein